MNNYIIFNFGKVVMCRNSGKRSFYKKVGEKLINLSTREEKFVKDIFKDKDEYLYRSEYLINIINQNDNISSEYKDQFKNPLLFLESIIPIEERSTFYKNLKSLKIKITDEHLINSKETGGYKADTNTFVIHPNKLNQFWEIAQSSANPMEFYQKMVSIMYTHEFSHMASSYFDPTTKIAYCGFDCYPSNEVNASNKGLTEGMTQMIANLAVPGLELSSYPMETLIVSQLACIVGVDTMLHSYFGHKGIGEIKLKLNQILNDEEFSNSLFHMIEDNYYLRNQNFPQTLLGNIQKKLLFYLNSILNSNKISNSAKAQLINSYELLLITPEKLKFCYMNPNNYIGIPESIEKFQEIKRKFKDYNKGKNI